MQISGLACITFYVTVSQEEDAADGERGAVGFGGMY